MRILKAKEIFKSTAFSENKEKMTKLYEEQLNIKAIKYFRDKYNNLLASANENANLLYQPIKKYEIFTLDTLGGKIFLTETSDLPTGENKELYYNFKTANNIYQKLIDIQDASFNEYEEVKELYEREILKNESEIEDLKLRDNELFKKDLEVYELISQTSLYENYQILNKDKENLVKKNEQLNKTISKYNENIRELSRRLKISLDRIEQLQKPKTFFEKLKELFIKDEKYLIDDRREK